MQAITDLIKAGGVYFIATDDNGQPRVRPFGAVMEFEGKTYIATGNKKDFFKQVMNNPRVELSSILGPGKWLRVSGELAEDTRREAKLAFFEASPALLNRYSIDDGIFAVLYFKSGTARVCSFTEPEVVYEL